MQVSREPGKGDRYHRAVDGIHKKTEADGRENKITVHFEKSKSKMATTPISRAEKVLSGALREAIPDDRWAHAGAMPFCNDFASVERHLTANPPRTVAADGSSCHDY